jgi:iron-sulfur cluster repair protein YtfE (RIC family)
MSNTASPEPVTAPLRAEHRELAPFITGLRTAAEAVGAIPKAELADRVNAALTFLTLHLAAHAAAEEAALYPVVDRLLGGQPVTATMSRDHAEISRLTAELGAAQHRLASEGLTDEVAHDLRRLLYGLHAVVALHFAKEEEVYLPILDARLSADDAAAMFADLARAASAHRRP